MVDVEMHKSTDRHENFGRILPEVFTRRPESVDR